MNEPVSPHAVCFFFFFSFFEKQVENLCLLVYIYFLNEGGKKNEGERLVKHVIVGVLLDTLIVEAYAAINDSYLPIILPHVKLVIPIAQNSHFCGVEEMLQWASLPPIYWMD